MQKASRQARTINLAKTIIEHLKKAMEIIQQSAAKGHVVYPSEVLATQSAQKDFGMSPEDVFTYGGTTSKYFEHVKHLSFEKWTRKISALYIVKKEVSATAALDDLLFNSQTIIDCSFATVLAQYLALRNLLSEFFSKQKGDVVFNLLFSGTRKIILTSGSALVGSSFMCVGHHAYHPLNPLAYFISCALKDSLPPSAGQIVCLQNHPEYLKKNIYGVDSAMTTLCIGDDEFLFFGGIKIYSIATLKSYLADAYNKDNNLFSLPRSTESAQLNLNRYLFSDRYPAKILPKDVPLFNEKYTAFAFNNNRLSNLINAIKQNKINEFLLSFDEFIKLEQEAVAVKHKHYFDEKSQYKIDLSHSMLIEFIKEYQESSTPTEKNQNIDNEIQQLQRMVSQFQDYMLNHATYLEEEIMLILGKIEKSKFTLQKTIIEIINHHAIQDYKQGNYISCIQNCKSVSTILDQLLSMFPHDLTLQRELYCKKASVLYNLGSAYHALNNENAALQALVECHSLRQQYLSYSDLELLKKSAIRLNDYAQIIYNNLIANKSEPNNDLMILTMKALLLLEKPAQIFNLLKMITHIDKYSSTQQEELLKIKQELQTSYGYYLEAPQSVKPTSQQRP